MSAPYFSVVIPCFNRAETIAETLKSVRDQTFSDYECLVVDDGSRDSELLHSVVESLRDVRFKYIHQANGGASAARNTGIKISKGKYIAFLDSDDLFLPDKLEKDHRAIKLVNDPNIVVFSQVLVDRGRGTLWRNPARPPHVNESICEYLLRRLGFTQTSTLVVERELAGRTLFREKLPMAQDFDFPIRLEANGAKFYMKADPGVIWKDVDDPNRVSSMPPFEPMLQWASEIRPIIGDRAYFAFRGSQISRLAAPRNLWLAFGLFLEALVRGAMPPKLMMKAAIQIILPRRTYRNMLFLIQQLKNR